MSDWPFLSEHDDLRRSIRAFVDAELAPHADEWEAAEDFPDSVFARLGELGFLGLSYPEEYGGLSRKSCGPRRMTGSGPRSFPERCLRGPESWGSSA
jgi:alkylation response protein AidB-like acyl-CoA dehydrogenase